MRSRDMYDHCPRQYFFYIDRITDQAALLYKRYQDPLRSTNHQKFSISIYNCLMQMMDVARFTEIGFMEEQFYRPFLPVAVHSCLSYKNARK